MIVVSAVISGVSFFLQLLGAVNLPATVFSPILTGGTMILSALAGVVLFRDKLTKNNVIGLFGLQNYFIIHFTVHNCKKT